MESKRSGNLRKNQQIKNSFYWVYIENREGETLSSFFYSTNVNSNYYAYITRLFVKEFVGIEPKFTYKILNIK